MQFIVLDMEWNQPWPGSYAAKKVLPVQIHGEIIQIGAVRLLEDGTVADEFQVLVCPKYYKKLNSRVSKLTGRCAPARGGTALPGGAGALPHMDRRGLHFPDVGL